MKNLVCAFGVLAAGFAFASSENALVHDERGGTVTSESGACVTFEGSDPVIAAQQCTPTPAQAEVEATEPEFINVNAYFDTDEAILLPQDVVRISEIAQRMGRNEKIVVKAFTDFRGTSNLNKKLAQERAKAVKDVLVENGIAPSQVEVQTRTPASERFTSPCADLKGKELGECLSRDRKVEVELRAR